MGCQALEANAASNNTAIGWRALQSNTTASNNTAVGFQAGYLNSTGATNVFVGRHSFYNNTTASNNTGIGHESGFSNTTGTANTALGQQALRSNTTASENTAVGYQSLYSSTGTSNGAFGWRSLYSNTTGIQNVGLGYRSGYLNTTGSYNTAIGFDTLYSNTTASNNTCVGFKAGYASTGYANTFVGCNNASNGAGSAMTTGTRNTILGGFDGNQYGLDIRTASNHIVLSDGDGNPRGIFDSSGNLLVGKTGRLAGEKLSVDASGGSSNTCAFTFGSSDDRSIVISLHAGSSGGTSRKHYSFLDAGGFERGSIGVNGSSTSYVTSSDYRLKENIAPMAGALSVVQQLKPCTYTWKNSGIAGQGFLAHELAEVCPDAVTGEKDAVDAEGNPQYQGIDTSFLVATLTAAIQELKAEFDAYKATHP
jgi:trimeric autotransporter adhesin